VCAEICRIYSLTIISLNSGTTELRLVMNNEKLRSMHGNQNTKFRNVELMSGYQDREEREITFSAMLWVLADPLFLTRVERERAFLYYASRRSWHS
jgi:hypothetical protein